MKKNMFEQKALRLRQVVLAMAYHAGGAHITPAYSVIDIMSVLFYGIMNFSPEKKDDPLRDRFLLSKGHGCAALYAVLAELGFFEELELRKFCTKNGILGGHPDMHTIPGVEASTGSLGHGIGIACGMAFAGKLKGQQYKVFTIVGDGECQEGSVWEAAMFAVQNKLNNLTVIIDYNKLQGMGKVNEINSLKPLGQRWKDFGWAVTEIDGHDYDEIYETLKKIPFDSKKPSLIVAHTVKGKGVSFMESKPIWHYRLPNTDEMKIACQELNIADIDEVIR